MNILIVDDSKAMRSIVLRTLRHAGYTGHKTKEATNGAEALQMIRESEPDLVISDWNMPEMNGIDLLKALRDEDCQVPFGFVTTEASPEQRRLAMESGAGFLITKPFTAEDFQSALDKYLD